MSRNKKSTYIDFEEEYQKSQKKNDGTSENGYIDFETEYQLDLFNYHLPSRLESITSARNEMSNNYNSRFFDKDGNFINSYRGDTKDALSSFETSRASAAKDYEALLNGLAKYEKYLDADKVKTLKDYLTTYGSDMQSMYNAYKLDSDNYSRYADEDAYNRAMAYAKEQDEKVKRYSSMTDDELEAELKSLEDSKKGNAFTNFGLLLSASQQQDAVNMADMSSKAVSNKEHNDKVDYDIDLIKKEKTNRKYKQLDELPGNVKTLVDELTVIDSTNDEEEFANKMATLLSGFTGGNNVNYNVGSGSERRGEIIQELESMGVKNWQELLDYNKLRYNEKKNAATKEEYAQFARENPKTASFVSIPASLGKGIGVLEMIENIGSDVPLDPNSPYFGMNDLSNTIRETVMDEHNYHLNTGIEAIDNIDINDEIYSLFMSTGDSAMAGLGGMGVKGLGGSVLGLSAASDAAQEVAVNGGSSSEAIATGLVSGVNEMLWETISLGQLDDLITNGVKKRGFVPFVKELLKSMGINASEEFNTEVANLVGDYIINGGASTYAERIKEYLAVGYTEEEARKLANKDMLSQSAKAGVSGALQGLLMGVIGGTGSTIANAIDSKSYENKFYNKMGSNVIANNKVSDLVGEAKDLGNSKLAKLANVAEGVNAEELSTKEADKFAHQVGKLYKGVQKAQFKNLSDSSKTALRNVVKAELEKMGVDDVDATADIVVKAMTNKGLTRAENRQFQSVDGRNLVDKVMSSEGYVKTLDEEQVKQFSEGVEKIFNTESLAGSVSAKAKRVGLDISGYKLSTDGKNTIEATDEEVDSMLITSFGDDGVTLDVKSGDTHHTVIANELRLNEDYAAIIEGLDRINEQFGLDVVAANNILSMWENHSGNSVDFYKAIESGIMYGQYNMRKEFEKSPYANELSPEQRDKVFEMGREYRQKVTDTKAKAIKERSMPNNEVQVTFAKGVQYHKLTKSQKAQVDMAQIIARAFGFNLEVFRSPKVNGKSVGENGSFSPSANLMRLDVDAGTLDGKALILFTQGHELTHYIKAWSPSAYKKFADFLIDKYEKNGVSVDRLVKDKIEQSKLVALSDKTREVLSYDGAFEEVVCDACEDFLADPNIQQTILEIAKVDQSLADKIKNFIKNLINRLEKALKDLQGQSKAAGYTRSLDANDLQELKDLWTSALVDARENVLQAKAQFIGPSNSIGSNVQFDSETNSVSPMYSERTWSASAYVKEREATAQKIAKTLGIDVQEALKYIDDVNSVAKLIADDRVRLDYEPNLDPKATVVKPNSEYKYSVDMSTLCSKRLLFTGTFDAIQRALPNTVFDSDDIVELREMMKKKGFEVACGICYVESTRREIGKITNDFIESYKEAQRTGKPITRVNSEGKVVDLKKTKEQQKTTADKSTDKFYAEKGYTPTLADLNTTDIDLVKRDHPLVYEAYLNFMNARGQAKPKLLETRAEYKGEILKHFASKSAVSARNKAGGLRLQSFSDFEVPHLIDMMQVIMDMSRVGLMSQAYTKVPAFAYAFGNTGVKINLSLIAKGDGIDADGNLIFDDVEGINHEEAFKIRDRFSKNVGTILVGKNDAHIIAAMADDKIDFIIPFHKSSWKESLYDALGLTGYDDYTATQNEKPIDGSRKISNFAPSEYWVSSKSGDENAQIYLQKCKEDGRIPKFPQFQNYKGYWKLLIDFKMYDNNGVGSPQMPVKPTFENQDIKRILDEYKGGHRNLPVAKEIVDEFVEKKKVKKDDTKHQDRDSTGRELSPGQIEFFKDSKVRDAKGNLLTVYHGTKQGGFTVFSETDDIGYFFTDSATNAGTYSGTYEEFAPQRYSSWEELIKSVEDTNVTISYDDELKTYTVENGWYSTEFGESEIDSAADEVFALVYDNDYDNKMNYLVYLNLTDPLIVNGNGSNWDNVVDFYDGGDFVTYAELTEEQIQGFLDNGREEWELHDIVDSGGFSLPVYDVKNYEISYPMSTRDWVADAQAGGFDGVIFKNINDSGGEFGSRGYESNVYVALNSNQIKSVNNLTPTESDDIRYQDRVTPEQDAEYVDAVNRKDVDTLEKMVVEAAEKAMPNSKVRDDNGKLRMVYHGRVSEFNVFDRSFSNIEGDFGKGYYFTSNEYDVDSNYASEEGPDLVNKIARYAEKLEYEDEFADLTYEEREEIAREKLITSEPNTITAYLNMENPVYITPNEQGTFLDFNEEYDEEYDEYGEPEGLLVDFIEALNNNAADYSSWGNVDFSFLYDHAYDGGLYAADVVKIIKDNIIDELIDENGDLAVSEVIRLAFEDIGFDGIIDSSVYYKFRNMNGMDSGTTHYIVFNSNQIKEADLVTYDDNGKIIPLSERFNEEENDIRYQARPIYSIDEHPLDKYNKVNIPKKEYWRVRDALTQRYNNDVEFPKYVFVSIYNPKLNIDNQYCVRWLDVLEFEVIARGGKKLYEIRRIYNDYHQRRQNSVSDGRNGKSEYIRRRYSRDALNVGNGRDDRRDDSLRGEYTESDRRKSGQSTNYSGERGGVKQQDRPYQPSLEDLGIDYKAENDKLKADVDRLNKLLKLQRTLTHGALFTKTSVDKAASLIMKEFGLHRGKSDLSEKLNALYTFVASSNDLTWDEFYDRASQVANWIIDSKPDQRYYKNPYASEVLKNIRERGITLNEKQKEEAAYYAGSLNAYRKSNIGNFKIVNEGGISLTELWEQLVEDYPGAFSQEDIEKGKTDTNLPSLIVEVIGTMRQTESVLEQMDRTQEVRKMVEKIYDTYWNVTTLHTLADKHQKEVNLLKGKHRAEMDALKEKGDENLKQVKERYREMLQKVREDKDAKMTAYKEHVAEQRHKSVEGRNKTAAKNKIKRVVQALASLYNNPTKERNVKIEFQDMVEKALVMADAIFNNGNISVYDILSSDIPNLRESERKDLEKWRENQKLKADYQRELDELEASEKLDQATHDRLLKGISECNRKLNYYSGKLKEVIEVQRGNLNDHAIQNAIDSLVSAYKSLNESTEGYAQAAYNEYVDKRLVALKEALKNTTIKTMTQTQLDELYQAYKMVLTTVRKANELFIKNKKMSVADAGEEVMREVQNVAKVTENKVAMKQNLNKFMWEELKPVYAFERIGSETFMNLYKEILRGQSVFGRDIDETVDFFQRKSKAYNYDSWDLDERRDFKLVDGRTFTISLQEIMSIYAYSKREQALDHITKGGFVFDSNEFFTDNKEKGIKGKIKKVRTTVEAYRLNDETFYKVINSLTPEQKKFVDDMQDYLSTVMGAKGNEVSRELYGIDLFREKYYFPLMSSHDFIQQTNNPAGEVALKNSGMAKATVPHARNPIILKGFMDVWSEHVNKMSTYHAFVLPIENLNKVFNYTGYATDNKSVSVQTILNGAYGPAVNQYITTLLQDLNGGIKVQGSGNWVTKGISLFKKTAVAASTSVVIQQPTAIVRALAMIDGKYFVHGRDGLKHNEAWDELKKYAPIAVIKEMGGFDVGGGKQVAEYITAKSYKGLKKVGGFFKDSKYRDEALMWGASKADEFGWITIWSAVKKEIADTTTYRVGSEEFLQSCGERFTEVVDYTQVYDSVLSRSGFMRNKGEISKMATSFMGEPTTSFNMLYNAVLQLKRGNVSKLGATKIVGATMASIIFAAIAKSLIYALRDDDEDEAYAEKYAQALTDSLKSDLFIPNMLPYVSDITSLFSGWDVERTDMAILKDLKDAIDGLDSSSKSPYRKVEDLAGAIAAFGGIPLKNVMRTTREMYNAVANIFDGNTADVDDVGDAVVESFVGETTTADVNKALEKGNTAKAKEIINDLVAEKVESGKTEKEAKASIKASVTSYWKALYLQAYRNKDNAEMLRIRRILQATGLYDDVLKTCSNWIKGMKNETIDTGFTKW